MIICILHVVGVVVGTGGVGRVISVVTIVGVLAIVPPALSCGDMPFFLTYRVRRSYDDFTIISGRDLKVLQVVAIKQVTSIVLLSAEKITGSSLP